MKWRCGEGLGSVVQVPGSRFLFRFTVHVPMFGFACSAFLTVNLGAGSAYISWLRCQFIWKRAWNGLCSCWRHGGKEFSRAQSVAGCTRVQSWRLPADKFRTFIARRSSVCAISRGGRVCGCPDQRRVRTIRPVGLRETRKNGSRVPHRVPEPPAGCRRSRAHHRRDPCNTRFSSGTSSHGDRRPAGLSAIAGRSKKREADQGSALCKARTPRER